MKQFVTVVIPAYNEEPIVKKLVADTLDAIEKFTNNYEIIVVDDGSTDKTFEKVSSLHNAKLRVVRNDTNLGKTRTMIRGFGLAKGDIVSFIDADYQYAPKDLISLINKVCSDCDICTGNRRSARQDSVYRKFMSFAFNSFNYAMFGIEVNDVNCGLKAFKKVAFNKIKLKYLNAKWFIDTELLARCQNQNIKIVEVDINHYSRREGISKVNCAELAFETLVYGFLLKKDFILDKIWSVILTHK